MKKTILSQNQAFDLKSCYQTVLKSFFAVFLMLCSLGVCGQTTDLFFSEYVEGSSNNKYIELYNGTGASVNLANYEIRLFTNGSVPATSTLALSGTLANGATVVYKNSLATIYSGTAIVDNGITGFNGDDALGLWKISSNSYVDIFGRIGNDPGTQWTAAGGCSTLDKTLRRKSTVCGGVTTNPTGTGASAFTTLSTEWDVYDIDTFTGLGSHIATCSADTTAPTLSTLSPLDDATDVGVNSNLVMTFDENVKAGTAGNIIIYNGSGTVFETIPYNDSRITYSGKSATINPTGTFANSSDYYVQIGDTAITDTAGNTYAGINDTTSWNFTTVAITYSITVTQATGGTITPGTQTGITSGSSSSAFTATPTSCYTFASWTIDGTPNASTVNPYTFTSVNANHTLTAVYTLKTYNITASAGANGSISPNGPTAVNCGASQTYTITPNSGYAVDDVLVDGVSAGAVTTYLFTNVTAARTIAATFKVYVGPCGSETFANIPSNASAYADRTWTGDNGEIWNATKARTDQTLNGRAIATDGSGTVTSPIYPNGMGVLSFNYVKAFTGTSARSIDVYVNGVKIGNTITVNATSNTVTNYSETINISGDVQLEFRTSGAQITIDDISWTCNSTPGNTTSTDYFRSKKSGGWAVNSTWESSADGVNNWAAADRYPGSSASGVEILNPDTVTITNNIVKITNTKVHGMLKITDYNYQIVGDDEIELSIENGGELLVDGLGYKTNIGTDQPFALIKSGGKITVGNTPTDSGFSENIVKFYLDTTVNGLLFFENEGICDWTNTSRYPQSNGYPEIFSPFNVGDMPIFRISGLPTGQSYGNNSNDNIINAILEIDTMEPFNIQNTKIKTVVGGIRGNGTVTFNAGNLNLGNASVVPELGGTVVLKIMNTDDRLSFPNGANVTAGANFRIESLSDAENRAINRSGGTFNIDGTLDITNLRITNTSTGGISVNDGGILRTRNIGGLYGTGSAITSGILNLNSGSTIDYYADVNQNISTGKDYYNIIFSGSGGIKTPSATTAINVNTAGKVTITGNPTINFTSNNLASISANSTDFDMDGGRLILGTAQLLPNMRGDYNITGGTIEFTANASGIRTPNTYHNIEITVPVNKEVTYAGGNLTLNTGASVLVKSNATLTSTSGNASLVGNSGNMLTLESGATFKTAVISGFYGPSGLPNLSPSVRDNITLDLKPGSTVEYARLSGEYGLPNNALSGDQTITPLLAGYQKLQIVGDGIKTAKGEITVNEMTNLSSTSATLVVPGYDILTNPVYSVFYALGGISNTNGTSGNFILGNDAQLMQNAIAVNTAAKIEAQRNLILTAGRKEYNYLISPVEGQDMKSIIGEDPDNIQFVTKINEATSMFVNAGFGPYVKGLAYAVKETVPTYNGPGFNVAQFKGKPFNDDLNFQLYKTAENRGYNLSGNPYPSNLDLDALYTASSNIESTFRFWDNKANNIYAQQGGGYQGYSYAFYNAVGGTGTSAPAGNGMSATGTEPNNILKVGQGFMIRVDPGVTSVPLPGTAATLSFKNSQRIVDQTDAQFFGRNAKSTTKDRYWLEYVTPSNLVISNAVVYFAGGTNLFSADDTRFPGSSDALYTMAEETKVIINGRSPFEVSDIIPLGTKAFTAGTYKIRLGKKEGIFANGQAIYLKDKLLAVLTDISQEAYSFTSASGEFTNRFEIVYQPEIVLGADDSKVKATIQIYRDAQDFVIESSSKKITSYELYEMCGRMIINQKTNAKEIRFNAERLVDGAYVLKVELENGEQVTRKIRK